MATLEFQLSPDDNQRLANLCGQFDEHLRQIEGRLDVELHNRGGNFRVSGGDKVVRSACSVLQGLYESTAKETLTPEKIHLYLQEANLSADDDQAENESRAGADIITRNVKLRCRGKNQQQYVKSIRDHDLSFGIGPAGTGKSYLAVACAVKALEREQVRRMVLVRPAVEAGERLGFLPGDLTQKVDPYLPVSYTHLTLPTTPYV